MTEITSIASAIRDSDLPDLEARMLLGHVLGVSQALLIAHAGDELGLKPASEFSALCGRRRGGEPIAYLIGWREFYGLRIGVTPDVLIPRPETELLVDLALLKLPPPTAGDSQPKRLLDLGTGSGCIALAIANSRPRAEVTAADISTAALDVARGNAAALGVEVVWVESDWFAALGGQRFDLIVANPPYIAPGDPHLGEGDLRFEPKTALTSPEDGLAAIGRVVDGSPRYLTPGGWLMFEHGYNQAARARDLLMAAGFEQVETWRDLAGIERVSGGRLDALQTKQYNSIAI